MADLGDLLLKPFENAFPEGGEHGAGVDGDVWGAEGWY